MKEETGVVVEVKEKAAKVKVSRHSDCENCGSCPGDSAMVVEVQNPVGAQPGQRVVFQIMEGNMLKAAFVVYILPMIFVSAGIYGGYLISQRTGMSASSALLSAAGGVIAFILSVIIIKNYDKASRQNTKTQPVITRIL
jgi:sigma-E factor negative regulatory protein RseC